MRFEQGAQARKGTQSGKAKRNAFAGWLVVQERGEISRCGGEDVDNAETVAVDDDDDAFAS